MLIPLFWLDLLQFNRGVAGRNMGEGRQCTFERLLALAGEGLGDTAEHALAVLQRAGSCNALRSCPHRLGCSWLAMILASRLSAAAVGAAEHDRVLAASA